MASPSIPKGFLSVRQALEQIVDGRRPGKMARLQACQQALRTEEDTRERNELFHEMADIHRSLEVVVEDLRAALVAGDLVANRLTDTGLADPTHRSEWRNSDGLDFIWAEVFDGENRFAFLINKSRFYEWMGAQSGRKARRIPSTAPQSPSPDRAAFWNLMLRKSRK